MLRLTAIFVAICVILIAASLGAVAYLLLGLSGPESSIVALAVLCTLALYNTINSRLRDRTDVGDQIADLSRGMADLARQVAEHGRKLVSLESEIKSVANRIKVATDPLAAEIGELGTLIKQLAETLAAHESMLAASRQDAGASSQPAVKPNAAVTSAAKGTAEPAAGENKPSIKSEEVRTGPFKGKSREDIIALIRDAIDTNRVDLYLQPILTLPQRKVRYYEGVTRLRTEDGTLILPVDFLHHAESVGLMPKIDNLLLFRCVQVLRRLLAKNREIGLFCNISPATLRDPAFFPQFSQFMDANRALAPSLMLEFTQSAFASMGPIEQESMAALADLGFRYSMDQVTDLRVEPRDLIERAIRFVKAPAGLLLNRSNAAADIHAADLSNLLGRHGISLIAEKIETEAIVVDLLDFDVRYGQGFLFSPPRPVRAEALRGVADRNDVIVREPPSAGEPQSAGTPPRRAENHGGGIHPVAGELAPQSGRTAEIRQA